MPVRVPPHVPIVRRPQPETVDGYLEMVPATARTALERLRVQIQEAAPEATESIEYKMPVFSHHGPLVGFAARAGGCTFYTLSPAVLAQFTAELRYFNVGKGCVHFSPTRPVPSKVITALVRARVRENEGRA